MPNSIKRNKGKAPKGLQNFFEPMFEFIRDDVVIPNIGEKHYKKYLPFIMTMFFFIWIVNLVRFSSYWGKCFWKYCIYTGYWQCITLVGYRIFREQTLLEAYFVDSRRATSIENYHVASRIVGDYHKTICFDDSFVRQHHSRTHDYIEFNKFHIHISRNGTWC